MPWPWLSQAIEMQWFYHFGTVEVGRFRPGRDRLKGRETGSNGLIDRQKYRPPFGVGHS